MRLSILLILLTACDACESAPSTLADETESVESPADPAEPAEPETPPPPSETELLALRIDPGGHSRVRAEVSVGPRRFLVVQRDLMAAGMAAVDALPNADAVSDAFETLMEGCGGRPAYEVTQCIADISPDLSFLLENTAGRGSSWSVVALEGDEITRRSLVALTVHEETGDSLSRPSIRAEDFDGDSKMELVVELPVRPLRDDVLFDWGAREDGFVLYVLDETLEVQARWTSMWGVFDTLDDGDSPPRSTQCAVDYEYEEREDHSLLLSETCSDGDGVEETQTQVCRYDTSSDRYRCAADFANQLFVSVREYGRHYVAETEAELARVLPLGSAFTLGVAAPAVPGESVGSGVGAPAVDTSAAPSEPSAPPSPPAGRTSPGGPCTHVVQEPSPPLHVRAQPSSYADVLGDLQNGTRISVTERHGRWGRIGSPVSGWVWTADLQTCPP